MRNFGQAGYQYTPINIEQYVSGCWPQYVNLGRSAASKINSTLAAAAAAMPASGSAGLVARLDQIKNNLINHMASQQMYWGCPCIGSDPSDPTHPLCNQLQQEADRLVSDVRSLLSQQQQQAAQAAQAAQAVQPEEKPKQSEQTAIEQELQRLREAVAAKKKQKQAALHLVSERHRKQAEYGRDTQQERPKAAGYATEAEKLIGGRTGYYAKPAPAPETNEPTLGFVGNTSVWPWVVMSAIVGAVSYQYFLH